MGEIEAGHGKSAGITSIIILCFALVNVIVGFVWISYGGGDASGLWLGLLLAVTGVLGIVAWVKLNKIAMVFFLVFCIIDIICTIVQAIIAALAFLIWQLLKAVTQCTVRNGRCDCGRQNVPMEIKDCSWITDIENIFLTLMIANGLCTLVVFAGSIIGCMATCCASSPRQQPGVVVVQQPGVVVTSHTAQGYVGGPVAVGYAGQAGYAGQIVYPGQAGYAGQAGYPGQAGYAGQAGYPGQAGYVGQPVQPGQVPPPVYEQAQNPPEGIPMKGMPPPPDAAQ